MLPLLFFSGCPDATGRSGDDSGSTGTTPEPEPGPSAPEGFVLVSPAEAVAGQASGCPFPAQGMSGRASLSRAETLPLAPTAWGRRKWTMNCGMKCTPGQMTTATPLPIREGKAQMEQTELTPQLKKPPGNDHKLAGQRGMVKRLHGKDPGEHGTVHISPRG